MQALMISYYEKHPVVHTYPYPGIAELLASLNERGVILGIIIGLAICYALCAFGVIAGVIGLIGGFIFGMFLPAIIAFAWRVLKWWGKLIFVVIIVAALIAVLL